MQKNILKKTLVIWLMLLFIGISFTPTISSIGETFKDIEAFETLNQGGVSNLFSLKKPSLIGGYLGEEEIRYYNPDTLTQFYVVYCEPPCYAITAIRLTQDELSLYPGWNLTKVKVRVDCDTGLTEIFARLIIYDKGTSTQPGNIIYEDDTLYFDKTGFHIIELDNPISLDDHGEIWIGIELDYIDFAYFPVYTDEGPAVLQKGDWFNDDGVSWIELREHGLDCNWYMGAIVEGEWKSELSIINISGPIGINAEIKNIGETDANNLEYTMTVTGGILGGINRTVNGNKTKLVVDETEPISSGFLLGFGPISVTVTADADNAHKDSISKTGFILGPFVFGIK